MNSLTHFTHLKMMEVTEGSGVAEGGVGGGQKLQFLVVSILRVDGLPGFDRIWTTEGLYAFAALDFAGCKPQKTTKVSF